MQKLINLAVAVALATSAGTALADQGKTDVYDFGSFRVHVYNSNDAMFDASYIIESKNGLVTMEEPLFKVNVKEFNDYLTKLNKTVVKRISDYHLGGTFDYPLTMPEGMAAFVKGPVYDGMMKHFAQIFGDKIVAEPTGKVSEVAFNTPQNWAGVDYTFTKGATSDFPAASILIGGKVYYTHWTPMKMHGNPLQLGSRAAVDAELASAQSALKSGATLFIGGHGGAVKKDAVEFKIQYLTKVQELLKANKTPDAFAKALKASFPGLAGEEGLGKLAAGFYAK